MIILASMLLALSSLAPLHASCTPASGDAGALLRRAADVTGLTRAGGARVLRIHAIDITTHDYESDRMYSPFLVQTSRFDEWFEPAGGADRVTTDEGMVGGYQFGGATTVGGRTASYAVRDTSMTPSAELHTALQYTRPLTVWAVLDDWTAAGDARVLERCDYRDYQRVVLTHTGFFGTERLYLDPRTGFPVGLHRQEPHYLWGSRQVEYVYSNWSRVGDAHLPGASFRVVDGTAEISRTMGAIRLIPRDSAPGLHLPANTEPMVMTLAQFLTPFPPDTVRVSANTFLLRNAGYGETVTLARDTVFVFDATQGDARARQDSAWIGKLFPGKHAIALVVTDLAWPHVAGVRFWVANGATVISHRSSRTFLESVVRRRWTEAPDLLEQRREDAPPLRFLAVNDSLRLAGGAVTLAAIDGPSSEGALLAYIHADRFLWASDYIQTLRAPTQYVEEVSAAVSRMHFEPLRAAAEHLPLVDWARIAKLVSAGS